jgi:hypothetical protein
MDPYLEAPGIWPDVHQALASEIRGVLNQALPEPYYARMEARVELGVARDDDGGEVIVPDVSVAMSPRQMGADRPGAGGVAVLDRPRREVSPGQALEGPAGRVRHPFVEIRDAKNGHKLVTLIEILSPTNKRTGPDREAYERKQGEVLGSDASLIEIDLLRSGRRVLANDDLVILVGARARRPGSLVMVSRAWRRVNAGLGYHAYVFGLREWMPCVPVPLREGEAEVPLDLQYAFNRMYDAGPYRRSVDYSRPPEVPLSRADAAWAAEVLGVTGCAG